MSKHTIEQLHKWTLIGMTGQYGDAWHGKGDFSGEVPFEEAKKFVTFDVDTVPVFIADIDAPLGFRQIDGKRAVINRDTGDIFQVASDGWRPHEYPTWLVDHVATLLDGGLKIGSVFMPENGKRCVVQVRPDEGLTIGNDQILPWLAAFSSMDGSWATSYKRCMTRIVCDNTGEMAYREGTPTYKVKHTAHSTLRVQEARDMIGVMWEEAEEFSKLIDQWQNETVTDKQFTKVCDLLYPIPNEDGRGKTIAEGKHERLHSLWNHDMRVAPWKNTAWGAIQADNTFRQHFATVRNVGDAGRVMRNVTNLIDGKTAMGDKRVIRALELVNAN